ncbi:fimbria/pilus outer membrane usher protein [Pseudocitrobacter corydidari]|uniref:Outer membrane usher protein HtrE n=1 Tax=Pseudocitrobacter corydidari TaxID=2891570 RepID=A0ABY3SBP4_9ENTR|nr:fimbria/pilus outer membrane usher protein [Pseudocitrobacter corydidari]UGS43548.1 Outer membrane usher protein HtrE [Pseudocitrobacter corydidari]
MEHWRVTAWQVGGLMTLFCLGSGFCRAEQSGTGEGATDYEFDNSFIVGSQQQASLKRFDALAFKPGVYSVDVYTNESWKGRYDVHVDRTTDGKPLICYTKEMLENFGLSPEKLNSTKSSDEKFCGTLADWNSEPALKDTFSASAMRLDFSVPQQLTDGSGGSYIPPQFWDQGVPGLNLGYTANYYNILKSDSDDKGASAYLGINAGLSALGWQLRHSGNYTWDENSGENKWTSNQTYLRRPIAPMKSVLTMGQFNTNGTFFDTIRLLGGSLQTDDLMFSDNMRSYAPVVNGVAQTNALVTVRQDGNIIYQTTVTPGPFSLTDVYPAGTGNDLIVTLQEADGRTSTWSIPYDSVVQLLHPGMALYGVAAGQVDEDDLHDKPTLGQANFQYGLNNTLTLYSALTGFNDYQAGQIGTGINTGIGALGFDITQARTKLPNSSSSGQEYRATFSRMFGVSQTSVNIQGWVNSSDNYYSLRDAIYARDDQMRGIISSNIRQKSGVSYSINQQFPDPWGALYLNGSITRYWNYSGKEQQYSLGYSNNWGNLSWSVTVQRTYSNETDSTDDNGTTSSRRIKEDMIFLSFSYPLFQSENSSVALSSNTQFKDSSFDRSQLGVNGSVGEDHALTWGVNSNVDKDGSYTTSVNGGYIFPKIDLSGSYSYGRRYQQTSASAEGSIVAIPGEVILTSTTGTTLAVVEAKDAAGASIVGAPTWVDNDGYAVVSSLQPYRVNNIEIDPKGIDEDVQFSSTEARTVPYEGSIVKVVFNTRREKTRIFIARQGNGMPLPFGSEITDGRGKSLGFVGQGSTLYITGDNVKNAWVRWDGGQCQVVLPVRGSQQLRCL